MGEFVAASPSPLSQTIITAGTIRSLPAAFQVQTPGHIHRLHLPGCSQGQVPDAAAPRMFAWPLGRPGALRHLHVGEVHETVRRLDELPVKYLKTTLG